VDKPVKDTGAPGADAPGADAAPAVDAAHAADAGDDFSQPCCKLDGGGDGPAADGAGVDGAVVCPADAGAVEQVFVASLTGAEVVPPVATEATGSLTLVLNAARTELRFQLRHNVAGASLAHLHLGAPGVNGTLIISFTPLSPDTMGTVAITADQATALEAGGVYADIHTAAAPIGAIRGQVLRPGESLFLARLTGAQETPSVTSAVIGAGSLIVTAARDGFRFRLGSSLVPTAAHIHRAPGGLPGPIIFPIEPPSTTMTGARSATSAQIADLERGLWYFNIHTAANQAGEIRGQLLRPGEVLYTAILAGSNQVPPVMTTATGAIGFILNAAGNSLRYDGAVTGVVPALVHIHAGAAGVNGAVIQSLMFSGTIISGALLVPPPDVTALNATRTYADVHTAARTAGELRGQITRR
jgi:hypothetical protein